MIPTCEEGVCGKGKWTAYYGGKTAEQCKELCESTRRLVPIPDGVTEKVYGFRQNGRFHDVSKRGGDLKFERSVPKIDYKGTGGFWDDQFKKVNKRDHFYVRWEGFVEVKAAGAYEFCTQSDDGSHLYIEEKRVVNNPGWHGMRTKCGTVDLAAGKHAFWTEVFEGGGGAGMRVFYKGPDTNGQRVIIPPEALSSTDGSGDTNVTLKLPSGVLDDKMCNAYSHKGTSCITYTSCSDVSPSADNICEDASIDFVGALPDFTTCTYEFHQWLPTTTTTTLPPRFVETRYGDKNCPEGSKPVQDEATCRETAKELPGKRWNKKKSWHNIQPGCFSHSNANVWFNTNSKGRTHRRFSSICEVVKK